MGVVYTDSNFNDFSNFTVLLGSNLGSFGSMKFTISISVGSF